MLQCIRSLSLNSQLQSGVRIPTISVLDLAFCNCSLRVRKFSPSRYRILMASKVTAEPERTLPGVQPWLTSDSVTVVLSAAFNPAKPPGYCSHCGYGQGTKPPFCSVTLRMKMPKYHFSFRPQTCRFLKKKTPPESVFPGLQEM